jgi:lipoate-protein ligase A
MTTRKIRLTRETFREPAALDTAVSRALLRQVARSDEPETLRLYTPADVVAFGPQDTRADGYGKAAAAARAAGFEAVERLAGGRAAVFHSGTIAFSWTMPDTVPREDVMARFDETADIMMSALRRLGIDARVGEVPGEYCPGQHSVNARGERKLMGVGQRLIRGAAHVGGVVVVEGGERIRDVLLPVYDALNVHWRPDTVGSIENELGVANYDAAARAILDEFVTRYTLYDGALSSETLRFAKELAPEHLAS